jgi:hypothetical protein
MSSYHITVPSPDEINYHEAVQTQRVERAMALIDPGDVLAVIDSRIAAEPDPTQHPLYPNLVIITFPPVGNEADLTRWHESF